MVHYQIDRSGNYVVDHPEHGWSLVLNGSGYVLEDFSEKNQNEILSHLPHHISDGIRKSWESKVRRNLIRSLNTNVCEEYVEWANMLLQQSDALIAVRRAFHAGNHRSWCADIYPKVR